MGTTRLELYNAALRICGERPLASLSEDREPRRLLDGVWDDDGVQACLEAGQWKFAMRAVQVDYDTTITPEFGLARAFTKPTDWVITSALCSDEYFQSPLTQYVDEAGYWYADIDTIYVRYVSDDTAYGMDLSSWPGSFKDFVAATFAAKIIYALTADKDKRREVKEDAKKAMLEAKNRDAMAGPQQFQAPGSWAQSRMNYRNSQKDFGNKGSLIG